MKFSMKKYIYLLNDFTNLLLGKEQIADRNIINKLRVALIIVSIILVASLILNICFYLT